MCEIKYRVVFSALIYDGDEEEWETVTEDITQHFLENMKADPLHYRVKYITEIKK